MKTTSKLALLAATAATIALAPIATAQQRPLSLDIAGNQPQPAPVQQQQQRPSAAAPAGVPAAPLQPDSLQYAIQGGQVSLDARLRYEFADQEDFNNNANALTLHTRLGYTTAAWHGLAAGIEVENTVAIISDYADSITPNPKYPVVMDPEVTEVNQAWLRYTHAASASQVTAGRQRIVHDNARFVGDVGWRQDNQTFDAISYKNTSIENLVINYAWLWRINRVQGDQRDWRSNSHIANATYAACQYATITAYGCLLDFYNHSLPAAAANTAMQAGSQTLGASLVGTPAINNAIKLNYRLEYAHQTDYGHNPADYSTHYLAGELGATCAAKYGLALGYEQLGSDNGQGFRTPLATLHAFNGWSDWTLPLANNLPHGLRDSYVKASATLPGNVQLLAFYHKFEADTGGADYGNEIDVQVTYRLNKNITFLAKAAFFSGKNNNPDLTKFWLQTEYSF